MIDAIQLWNDVALETSRAGRDVGDRARSGPMHNLRVLAMVHQAMYDAYVTVAKPAEFEPSLPGLPAAPAGATASAAIAGAAHGILTALCPEQRARLDATLAAAADPGDPGLPIGRAVAAALLETDEQEPGDGGGSSSSPRRGPHRADPGRAAAAMRGALRGTFAGAALCAANAGVLRRRPGVAMGVAMGVTMGPPRKPRGVYPRAASPAASVVLGAP
jgi:Vanadium chloroperoxidase N-terminal domain